MDEKSIKQIFPLNKKLAIKLRRGQTSLVVLGRMVNYSFKFQISSTIILIALMISNHITVAAVRHGESAEDVTTEVKTTRKLNTFQVSEYDRK